MVCGLIVFPFMQLYNFSFMDRDIRFSENSLPWNMPALGNISRTS